MIDFGKKSEESDFFMKKQIWKIEIAYSYTLLAAMLQLFALNLTFIQ